MHCHSSGARCHKQGLTRHLITGDTSSQDLADFGRVIVTAHQSRDLKAEVSREAMNDAKLRSLSEKHKRRKSPNINVKLVDKAKCTREYCSARHQALAAWE